MVNSFILFLIRAYQIVLSPLFHLLLGTGFGCRFQPTCSDYAQQAIGRFGPTRGSFLTLKRILRCHPGCKGGWDPIPESFSTKIPVGYRTKT